MSKIYNIIIPLWGDKYISRFERFILPSLLTKNNLFYLNKLNDVRITFCTINNNINYLKHLLIKYNFKLKFITIDELIKKAKTRRLLHLIYLKGIKSEVRDHKKVNFLFFNSDDFFSNNYLKEISLILKKNKNIKCILENKILVDEKKLLKKIITYKDDKAISINSTKLFEIGLQSLSNFSKFSFLNFNNKFNYNSYCLYWKVNEHNLLCSGFLLHPILIRPKKKITKMNGFLDYFLIPEYSSRKNIKILLSNNKLFRIGISNYENLKFIYSFDIKKYSTVLNSWLTNDHKFYSNFISHFSYKSISRKKLLSEKKLFISKLKKIHTKLNFNGKSHKNHPYWGLNKNIYAKGIKNYIRRIINIVSQKKIYYVK
jgi:hypothetical protein